MCMIGDRAVSASTCVCACTEHDPPIAAVLEAGAASGLVGMMTGGDDEEGKYEAAWALSNIASGSSAETAAVVQAGGIPALVGLLTDTGDRLFEQALWGLGNIAGDSPECRDAVLGSGMLDACLLRLMGKVVSLHSLRNGTWAISNLCRGKPAPPLPQVSPALPYLAKAITTSDVEVLSCGLWSLSYMGDGDPSRVQAVIDAGVVPRVVECLMHEDVSISNPALRCIGSIVSGDDTQTSVALDAGLLPAMPSLLTSIKRVIRKEACWTLSNITAGSTDQVQLVMNHGLVPMLVHAMADAEDEIAKEAAWAVANALLCGGSSEQVVALLGVAGLLSALAGHASNPDEQLALMCLKGIEVALHAGASMNTDQDGVNPVVVVLEECGGLDAIERAQQHPSDEVFHQAASILQKYFVVEDGDGGDDVQLTKDKGDDDEGAPKGQ